MMFRKYAPWIVLALPVVALYLLWLWQPERQVRLHTTHFLKKVERRNWEQVKACMASDYKDRWDHSRDTAPEDARDVFQQFLFVTIDTHIESLDMGDGTAATVRARLKITGSGGPIAQIVMERVNTLPNPFIFKWRHASWKPWDWQLTFIDQPELKADF